MHVKVWDHTQPLTTQTKIIINTSEKSSEVRQQNTQEKRCDPVRKLNFKSYKQCLIFFYNFRWKLSFSLKQLRSNCGKDGLTENSVAPPQNFPSKTQSMTPPTNTFPPFFFLSLVFFPLHLQHSGSSLHVQSCLCHFNIYHLFFVLSCVPTEIDDHERRKEKGKARHAES